MDQRIKFNDFIRKNWLLVGILFSIFLAALNPNIGSKDGPLKTELSVKYGAVTLIFLISGINIKTENIIETLQKIHLHLFIQLFTFILIPLLTQLFVNFLKIFNLNDWILKGLITVACMPPPVSSAVILTRAANGNETGAIFNSILGSFLGIILTPILLLINLGSTTIIPLFETIIQLILTVLLPLFLGQLLRNLGKFRGYNLPLNAISQLSLLFVVYTVFCDTFKTPEINLNALDIILTVFLVLLMQIILLIISYQLAINFGRVFQKSDVITIVFCSTHKSLTLGIPILRIMFHGFSHLSQISLPLLIYHPTQIILGGLMVAQLKNWKKQQKLIRNNHFPI